MLHTLWGLESVKIFPGQVQTWLKNWAITPSEAVQHLEVIVAVSQENPGDPTLESAAKKVRESIWNILRIFGIREWELEKLNKISDTRSVNVLLLATCQSIQRIVMSNSAIV